VKQIALIFVSVAAALALAGGVVLLGGDRSTLVPPPDAAAEQFVRQLATHRFDRAVPLLSGRLKHEIDAGRLAALVRAFEAQRGAITFAEGEERSRTRRDAVAEVHVETDRGESQTFNLGLTSEYGEWKIDRLGPPLARE